LPPFEIDPGCATGGHRIVVVRTYREGSGTQDEADGEIRSIIRRMNWKFMQQSALSSDGQRILKMKVDCEEDGTIDVHDVEIPLNYVGPGVDTTDGFDVGDHMNYATNQLGGPRDAEAVKYLIFASQNFGWFSGLAFLHRDLDKSDSDTYNGGGTYSPSENLNRVVTTASIVDGSSWDNGTPIHELLHTMGATLSVPYEDAPEDWVTAPYANVGSAHCADGIDTLCYNDGAVSEFGPYAETRCPASAGYGTSLGVPIDCMFDTYFDSKSEPGEWLDRFWNVGGAENPFLVEEELEEGVDSIDSDVNGDGSSDLVTVDSEGSPHVYRGVPTGIESEPDIWLREQIDPALYDGVGHYLIDTVDVTGEGRADLITLDSSGKVYVHAGWFYADYSATKEEVLHGAFAPGREVLSGLKPIMNSSGSFEPIAVADVNGDGRGDLVGVDQVASAINTYPGQSDGTFGSKVASTVSADSALLDKTGRYMIDVGDLNGDGRGDLVYQRQTGGGLGYWLGQANGTFTGGAIVTGTTALDDGSGEEPVGLGDVNADGLADFVSLSGTTLKVRLASGGTLSSATTAYSGSIDSSLFDGGGEELIGLLDYNADGRADLVSVKDDGDVLTYAAQSDGTFAVPVNQGGQIDSSRLDVGGQQLASEKPFLRRVPCSASGCRWPPAKAGQDDVNGDGRADLVTVDGFGTPRVYRGTSSGIEAGAPVSSLPEQVEPALYDGVGHYLIDTVDVTGEGRADLVTLDSSGGLYVHNGKGNRTFAPARALLSGLTPAMSGGNLEPIALADVDGDKDNDLIVHSKSASAFLTYQNRGDGTLNASAVTSTPTVDSALLDARGSYFLDAIDVTGDGRADLVAIDTNGSTYVYQGQSDARFASATSAASIDPIMDDGRGQEPVGLGDVDLDGKADLLTLDGTTLKLYAGKSDGTFATPTTPYGGSIDSNLLDGKGQELAALLDTSGDGRADLVSVDDQGDALTYTAQSNATFASPMTAVGQIDSSRLYLGGQQLATEKPFPRRAHCETSACAYPPNPPPLAEGTVAPRSTTQPASGVLRAEATLNATVNPGGAWSTYYFEYGPTTSYGTRTPAIAKAAGATTTEVAVRQAISGLDPKTTYHFRVVATNGKGTAYGADQTFSTWADWSLQTTLNPRPLNKSSLADVSCTSASSCIAVGYDEYERRSLIQTWSGRSWISRQGELDRDLDAVSCGTVSGVAYCMAVGTKADGTPYAQRWTGAGGIWSLVSTTAAPAIPAGGSEVSLKGISCTGRYACTAVGTYKLSGKTKPLAERYDDTARSWSIQTTATTADNTTLIDVSCPSASMCIAVGAQFNGSLFNPIAERWDGTSWSALSVPPPGGSNMSGLSFISCASSSMCIATGNSLATPTGPFALKWDGSSWTSASTGLTGSAPSDVSCPATNSCIAVGVNRDKTLTLMQAWNGSQWSAQSSPNPSGQTPTLSGLSCPSTSACTAVGKGTAGSETFTLGLGWDGTSWSLQTTPNPDPPDKSSLADVSCTSASSCIAVGYDEYERRSLIQTWDGRSWIPQQGLLESKLAAVSCGTVSTVAYCMAVGEKTDGTPYAQRWSGVPIGGSVLWSAYSNTAAPLTPQGGTDAKLASVSCTARFACTAVGTYKLSGKTKPLAERFDDATNSWSVQAPATTTDNTAFSDVACVSASECIAVGSQLEGTTVKPIAERWDGTRWSALSAPAPSGSTNSNLKRISCASASMCIATGYSLTSPAGLFALRWDGTSWTQASTGLTTGATGSAAISDVSCASTTSCMAVGVKDGKTLIHSWSGSDWSVQTSPNPTGTPSLAGVSCATAGSCEAVGKSTSGSDTVTLGLGYG
jgi:VCBS repeat protein